MSLIKYYRQRYSEIIKLPEPKRTYELAKLMTKMECEFNIPCFNNKKWNIGNKEVIELYREVSDARKLD